MSERPDTLHHWHAIAAHVGTSPAAARNMAVRHGLPTFKLGKTVCASRAALDAWLASLAAKPAQ